ncbi:hypothetical protein BGX38DRAFT_1265056 [Terfezia claveryi]|nr:hypothetical protein BGX38DRAFT_1265056 [Terfezia claveryi]
MSDLQNGTTPVETPSRSPSLRSTLVRSDRLNGSTPLEIPYRFISRRSAVVMNGVVLNDTLPPEMPNMSTARRPAMDMGDLGALLAEIPSRSSSLRSVMGMGDRLNDTLPAEIPSRSSSLRSVINMSDFPDVSNLPPLPPRRPHSSITSDRRNGTSNSLNTTSRSASGSSTAAAAASPTTTVASPTTAVAHPTIAAASSPTAAASSPTAAASSTTGAASSTTAAASLILSNGFTHPTPEQIALAADYQQAINSLRDLEAQVEIADAEFDRAAVRLLYLRFEVLEAHARVRFLDEKVREEVDGRMNGPDIPIYQ